MTEKFSFRQESNHMPLTFILYLYICKYILSIFQSELCSIFSETEYFCQQDKPLPVQQT